MGGLESTLYCSIEFGVLCSVRAQRVVKVKYYDIIFVMRNSSILFILLFLLAFPGSALAWQSPAPTTKISSLDQINESNANTISDDTLSSILDAETKKNINQASSLTEEEKASERYFAPGAVFLAAAATLKAAGVAYRACSKLPFIGKRCKAWVNKKVISVLSPLFGRNAATKITNGMMSCSTTVLRKLYPNAPKELTWITNNIIAWISPCG